MASLPIDKAVAGGIQDGFAGVSPPLDNPQATQVSDGEAIPVGNEPIQGMGFLLEADDEQVFKTVHDLVLRQEMLARNRLAQDAHWTYVIGGYPFSRLEKNDNQQVWKQSFPPGYTTLAHASVPNKTADLCNKYVETLLSDPPKPDPLPEMDSEVAEQAAKMAGRFLREDGTEAGTNDDAVFWAQVQRATATASTFNHYWVDPAGGGSIALQIKAHPQAQDPSNPLVAVDAMGQALPTTDYVLRYVTEDGQFTENPADAARQWLPKIRCDRLGREHVRIFPEHMDVERSQRIVVLYFSTIGEGKRRWPAIAKLSDSELSELCDWTPPRYLALLPPALRSRWKLATGSAKDVEGGSNDERMFFYYAYYGKQDPDYAKGAQLVVNGAFGGFVIARDTLSADVEKPSTAQQDQVVRDTYPMDLPLSQIRLIQDTEGLDPTGIALAGRFAGAGEAGAQLVSAYMEAMDITLHPARFFPSTSPVEGTDIENSRATGEPVLVLSPADYPEYETPPPLPPNFLQTVQWLYTQADLIAGLRGAVQNSSDSNDDSGVARKVQIRQALQSLSRSQQAIHAAYQRHWRIKCQLAMKYFTAPQQLQYVGEDGAYKQEWWTGNDFAAVAQNVRIQTGTGTMMSPQDKVQYVAAMQQMGFMSPEEAADAARPTFSGQLGLPDNPQTQRLERQISSWLEGMPEGWEQQAAAYDQAKAVNDQQLATYQASVQQTQAATQMTGVPSVMPPQPQPVPLPPLWTPFEALPVDDLPHVAKERARRLGNIMAQAQFSAKPKRWQQELIQAFQRARQIVALSQQGTPTPQPQAPRAPQAPPKSNPQDPSTGPTDAAPAQPAQAAA